MDANRFEVAKEDSKSDNEGMINFLTFQKFRMEMIQKVSLKLVKIK